MTIKNIGKLPDLVNAEVKQETSYSLVVPVYNEENSLPELIAEIEQAMALLPGKYQLIMVNDGSVDCSFQILRNIREKMDKGQLEIVDIQHQKGQTHALKKGFEHVSGRIIISLDADLQNNPADIPRLIKKMEEGFDVVCGWRRNRKDPLIKRILSLTGNFFQRSLVGLDIHDMSCTLRAYKNKVLPFMALDREGYHRYIPMILSRNGFKIGELRVEHRKRRYGKSKYKNRKVFKVIRDFFRITGGAS